MPVPSPHDMARINRAVQRSEDGVAGGPAPGRARSGARVADHQIVRVTSATPTSDRYPGVILSHDSTAKTYSDGATCWVAGINDQALTNGTRYHGRRTGDVAGVPVFLGIEASGAGKVKGVLDGALAFEDSATLSVWEHNGSIEVDTGANVTVHDWLLVSGQSVGSGTQVTAFRDPVTGRYYLDGAQCQGEGASGTVISVGLSAPAEFNVTGSPVTDSGTLALAWASAAANTFLAGPDGSSGTPAFRGITGDDLSLTELSLTRDDAGGASPVLDVDQTNASDTSPAARINQDGPGDILQLRSGGSTVSVFDDEGNLGVGTATPAARIHGLATTEQLRLSYDGSTRLSVTVDSAGRALLAAAGTAPVVYTTSKFGVGTFTSGDVGLVVYRDGSSGTSADVAMLVRQDGTDPIVRLAGAFNAHRMTVTAAGSLLLGTETNGGRLTVARNDNTSAVPVALIHQDHASSTQHALSLLNDGTVAALLAKSTNASGAAASFENSAGSTTVTIASAAHGIQIVAGGTASTDRALNVGVGANTYLRVRGDGQILVPNIATSDPGIPGAIYIDGSNFMKVSA